MRSSRRRKRRTSKKQRLVCLLSFLVVFASAGTSNVVVGASSSSSKCVPTITCIIGPNADAEETTCRAEWQCTWPPIAPKTNNPKRFSLLRGTARVDGDGEATHLPFNMTNVGGKSVEQLEATISPKCSEVGCDATKTSITLQTPDADDSFTSKECSVEETAKKCTFDVPSNRNDKDVFSEVTATFKCKNVLKPCSGSTVLVRVDFRAKLAAPPEPPLPPGAFAPGGDARKFFQILLLLVATYCSIGYALALAVTRGKWPGFTEACIRDGKGRNACGLLFFWWWPRFWTEEDERCLDAFYDDEERGAERRLLDNSSSSEDEEDEEEDEDEDDEEDNDDYESSS